ncbi:uncharacterized protein LOC105694640 [Orussus abietinus]|uniref:uncharacterized protein LOC105694640 n=1 Tax=Orussus abietinus TaxID=222816 RepID=UPI00062687D4|nr:uncharacterized protein LOC105694640 [Orussus abietinus]
MNMRHNCCKYWAEEKRKAQKKDKREKKKGDEEAKFPCEETNPRVEKRSKCKKRKKKWNKKCSDDVTIDTDHIIPRIVPPVDVRTKYMYPRHVNCCLEQTEEPCEEKIKKKKPCAKERTVKHKKIKRTKNQGKAGSSGKAKDQTQEKQAESGEGPDVSKEIEGNVEQDEEIKNSEKKQIKRRKPNFWCNKVIKKKKQEGAVEEKYKDETCASICSFDSEICLAGLTLTKKEMKKIEENRHRVRPHLETGKKGTDNLESAEESGDKVALETEEEKDELKKADDENA